MRKISGKHAGLGLSFLAGLLLGIFIIAKLFQPSPTTLKKHIIILAHQPKKFAHQYLPPTGFLKWTICTDKMKSFPELKDRIEQFIAAGLPKKAIRNLFIEDPDLSEVAAQLREHFNVEFGQQPKDLGTFKALGEKHYVDQEVPYYQVAAILNGGNIIFSKISKAVPHVLGNNTAQKCVSHLEVEKNVVREALLKETRRLIRQWKYRGEGFTLTFQESDGKYSLTTASDFPSTLLEQVCKAQLGSLVQKPKENWEGEIHYYPPSHDNLSPTERFSLKKTLPSAVEMAQNPSFIELKDTLNRSFQNIRYCEPQAPLVAFFRNKDSKKLAHDMQEYRKKIGYPIECATVIETAQTTAKGKTATGEEGSLRIVTATIFHKYPFHAIFCAGGTLILLFIASSNRSSPKDNASPAKKLERLLERYYSASQITDSYLHRLMARFTLNLRKLARRKKGKNPETQQSAFAEIKKELSEIIKTDLMFTESDEQQIHKLINELNSQTNNTLLQILSQGLCILKQTNKRLPATFSELYQNRSAQNTFRTFFNINSVDNIECSIETLKRQFLPSQLQAYLESKHVRSLDQQHFSQILKAPHNTSNSENVMTNLASLIYLVKMEATSITVCIKNYLQTLQTDYTDKNLILPLFSICPKRTLPPSLATTFAKAFSDKKISLYFTEANITMIKDYFQNPEDFLEKLRKANNNLKRNLPKPAENLSYPGKIWHSIKSSSDISFLFCEYQKSYKYLPKWCSKDYSLYTRHVYRVGELLYKMIVKEKKLASTPESIGLITYSFVCFCYFVKQYNAFTKDIGCFAEALQQDAKRENPYVKDLLCLCCIWFIGMEGIKILSTYLTAKNVP